MLTRASGKKVRKHKRNPGRIQKIYSWTAAFVLPASLAVSKAGEVPGRVLAGPVV